MCGVRERRVKRKKNFCGNEIYFSRKSCFSDRQILFKNPIIENQTHVKKRHCSRTAPVNYE